MATTIITKNSSTAGAAPTAGDLVQGELAVNVTDKALYTENASGTVVKLNAPSIVDNGNATAITIDSSENVSFAQNVGVGTTSQLDSGSICLQKSGASSNGIVIKDTNAGGGNQIKFLNSSGTTVGYINQNGTLTVYSTVSDYRLKENVQPMQGALATVSQLKPCTYSWKSTGESTQGFIAHELQEVVPECVIGEKDVVDADGNPQYQGIDTSFLVATLTAAIQELKTIVDTQAARITALEQA